MDLNEISINSSQPVSNSSSQSTEKKPAKPSEKDGQPVSSYVYDTPYVKALLADIKKKKSTNNPVVYGVYNNSGKGLWVKINDFLIDHSRIRVKEKSYFFHLLGIMVDAGVPVVQAVRSLAGHSENPRFARVLMTIAHNCDNGATLTEAMMRFDDVFDEVEMGVIRAGEASGKLNLMLHRLSDQLDKRNELNTKLWGAAAYPLAVVSVLVLVAVGMLVWVLPTLLSLLEEGGLGSQNLPTATRILIGAQVVIVDYWWLLLILIFGGYGLFTMYRSTDKGAIGWDYFKIRLPFAGILMRKVFVLRFVGMLGLLIESGLPVINALQIAGNSLTNRVYKIKTQEAIEQIKTGIKISDSISDVEFLFPHEVTEMLRVGEGSANLATVSQRIADQYQSEVDNSLKKMTSVFEPLMILFVGLFVALLALAIMAPIFSLSSAVGA